MAGHTPTPYTCSNRNWRGENDPHNWYIRGDHRESFDDDDEGDGEPMRVATSVAIVIGNETAGTIPRDTAKFLVTAANSHDELLAACKLARTELAYLIEQVRAKKGGSVDRAYQACKAAIAKTEESADLPSGHRTVGG